MTNKTTYIALGIGSLIALLLLILLIRKIKKDKSITDKIEIDESKLSYNLTDYTLWANQLFTSMKGAGTDYAAIERVLARLKTNEDWQALVKAFGTREVKSFTFKFSGTLYDWLQDELTTKETNKINTLLASVGVSI